MYKRQVVNTAKTAARSLKGHVPTAEEISFLESVDVRIVDGIWMTVVGGPIGRHEYVLSEHWR